MFLAPLARDCEAFIRDLELDVLLADARQIGSYDLRVKLSIIASTGQGQ
jgi:hypothetical protein